MPAPTSPATPRLEREQLPPALLGLCQSLSDAGHHAWLVGGCVRDSLLAQLHGQTPPGTWITKDWDVASDATPEQVTRIFRRVIPTGIEHGTVTVLLQGMQVEVTTLRAERGYADGRRPDQIEFVRSIEDDLSRRDFTVNAIAFEALSATIIDPFDGTADLERRLLRAVGQASFRFSEDGLRVLRAARFVATLEFELESETARAIEPSLDSYRRVSAERIRDEWNKLLRARAPSRGFCVMREHGLLRITAPELSELAQQPNERAMTGDRLSLALARVDVCPAEPELRLAALLRDLHESGPEAADAADALLLRLRYSNAERKQVTRLIRQRGLQLVVAPTAAELRHWLRRVGPDLYQAVCRVERADLEARLASTADPEQHIALRERLSALATFAELAGAELAKRPPLTLSELAIDGKQLMSLAGFRPGRELGITLAALLEQVIENPELNTPQILLERARALRA